MNEEYRYRRLQQKQSEWQHFILNRRWFRVLSWTLLGLLLMISLHVGFAVATGKPHDGVEAEQRGKSSDAAQALPPSAPSTAAQLVQQAEDHYQAGQLT